MTTEGRQFRSSRNPERQAITSIPEITGLLLDILRLGVEGFDVPLRDERKRLFDRWVDLYNSQAE